MAAAASRYGGSDFYTGYDSAPSLASAAGLKEQQESLPILPLYLLCRKLRAK